MDVLQEELNGIAFYIVLEEPKSYPVGSTSEE
jgi:hypothetical protein